MKERALSRQARSLWAKTGSKEQSERWGPLYMHMLDSAGVARILWNEWISDSLRYYIAGEIGLEREEAEGVVSFIAGIHDIGKATPNFQRKVPECAELVKLSGLAVPDKVPKGYPHASMGQIIVDRWFKQLGWDESVYAGYASIVGGHHGANPSSKALSDINADVRPKCVMGDAPWQQVQDELLSFVSHEVGFDAIESRVRDCSIPTSIQVLLTGLVIMADWIASNTEYFPLTVRLGLMPAVLDREEERRRVEAGWRRLSIPSAEHFAEENLRPDDLFKHRFAGLPVDAVLRPVQEAAVQAAAEADAPGLFIIEADTGGGKTEASLLAAELLASKFGEGGLAYLLPTQATSNAMYTRVESWLESVHADDSPGQQQDIHLLHGKAALNEDWKARASWGESWMGDDDPRKQSKAHYDDAIIAHQWFSGRKRGLLAPFVVGTVDQLLFMALNAKHVHLRHLGLAGKVVVIDEVHAYDAYMNVYLDRALTFLGMYQVPVILLSATLPPRRREELIKAYRGIDPHGTRRRNKKPLPQPPRTDSGEPAYPLITYATSDKHDDPVYRACELDERHTDFVVEYLADDDEVLVEFLRQSLSDGGCVCVLRNTVRRAQHAYNLLTEELGDIPGIEFRLVHSRFIAYDRANNDKELLDLLGPKASERPRALVVVGTQVIEQSLDIDFDLLVTDIAPIDLLLQRMGRVHRHRRGEGESQRPKNLRKAHCAITGIEAWKDGVPQFEKGTKFVYQEAILLRTVLALKGHETGGVCCLSTPKDTAALVEKVYTCGDDVLPIPDSWRASYDEALQEARSKRTRKEEAADSWLLGKFPPYELTSWMNGRTELVDEVHGSAKVRDTQESIEVVVVVERGDDYGLLPWVAEKKKVGTNLGNGQELPDDATAHAAALCTVSLPPALSVPNRVEPVVCELERQGNFTGWQDSRWLRGALPLVLDESYSTKITLRIKKDKGQAERKETFLVRYSKEQGLSCTDKGGE